MPFFFAARLALNCCHSFSVCHKTCQIKSLEPGVLFLNKGVRQDPSTSAGKMVLAGLCCFLVEQVGVSVCVCVLEICHKAGPGSEGHRSEPSLFFMADAEKIRPLFSLFLVRKTRGASFT